MPLAAHHRRFTEPAVELKVELVVLGDRRGPRAVQQRLARLLDVRVGRGPEAAALIAQRALPAERLRRQGARVAVLGAERGGERKGREALLGALQVGRVEGVEPAANASRSSSILTW